LEFPVLIAVLLGLKRATDQSHASGMPLPVAAELAAQ
jgi:hypothetical protein